MKKLIFSLIALLFFFSCQNEELSLERDFDNLYYGSMEQINATKTYLDSDNNVLWSKNDQLIAFEKTTLGAKYQVLEQYAGTNIGAFEMIEAPNNDGYVSGFELNHNVFVYPYSNSIFCMKNGETGYKLNVVLPQTQIYAKNTFANGSFPMVAVSSGKQLTFKNVCGGLKLQFIGVDKIKSITLEGLGNELISGKSSVIGYADGSVPTITMDPEEATESITLDCGDGVQLNMETPTTFIISVPPVEFKSGLQITVTDTDGLSRTLKNTSGNAIKRSVLLSFPVITYKQEGVFELPEGTLTSYEIISEGGEVDIPLTTNQDYNVIIPEGAGEWITVVETKALREETITLNIAKNTTAEARSAEVLIATTEGVTLQEITVSQEAGVPDLSDSGTANCYLVTSSGDYKFKAVKGNSNISVGDVDKVEVLWESFGTNIAPTVGDLVASVGYSDGYVTFTIPETFKNGNAVVAAKDANGKILWSWHIWCSAEGWTDQVYANEAGVMMDRNLGATSATPGDIRAFGLLYQWGRKDPFMGCGSISNGSISAVSTGSWNNISVSQSVDYAVANPMTFIKETEWCSESTEDQRWMNSQKTMYDPCPAGYRVPKGGESEDFWVAAKKGSEADIPNKGVYWMLDNNNRAWYPWMGYRNYSSGELSDVFNLAYYWSAAPKDDKSAYYLEINGGIVYTSLYDHRGQGCSVRCVKE